MKICIITGASKGLGLHMSETFQEAGYHVVNLDILTDEKNTTPSTDNYTFIKTDMSKPEDIERAFNTIKELFSTAHILINNAAIAVFEKSITQIRLEEYNQVLDTNQRGVFLASQAFIKLNKGQDYGRIINLSSTRWHQNMADWELYGMSKGAVVSLTNTLCVSLIGTPITVNAISPGWIHTGNIEDLEAHDHEIHPSNRVGKPEDISRVCLFLADEKSDFINGANIIVDGGMTKKMIY